MEGGGKEGGREGEKEGREAREETSSARLRSFALALRARSTSLVVEDIWFFLLGRRAGESRRRSSVRGAWKGLA